MYVKKGYSEEHNNKNTDKKFIRELIAEETAKETDTPKSAGEPVKKPVKEPSEKPDRNKGKKTGNKKKMPKGQRAAIAVLSVLLILVVGGIGGFQILKAKGKASLRENATSSIPTLLSESMELDDTEQGIVYYNGKKYRYNDSIISILCMGIDTNAPVEDAEAGNAGQADSIFLLVLDEKNKKMSMVALSRDIMTDIAIPLGDGGITVSKRAQLALQYAYWDGGEKSGKNMMHAVSKIMYNLPVHSYAAINLEAISLINDSVGGVTVTVPSDDPDYLAMSGYRAGQQVTLYGDDAELFVRNRNIRRSESNNIRISRQKEYMTQFVAAFKSKMKSDVTLPVKIYQDVSDHMNTDISIDRVSYLASLVLDSSFSSDNLHTVQGDITQPGRFEEFTVDDKKLYDMIISVFYEEVPQEGFNEVISGDVETVSTAVSVQ